MTITKKDIDVIKIKMTWDYITKDVDIRCRILLQYFAVLLTFIVGVMLATSIGNLDFWVAVPIVLVLLILVILGICKIRSYSRKVKEEILDNANLGE